jgi:hypothetical protein
MNQDLLSDIFDEPFQKEISHNYNVFQTDRQIRLLTEDIKEIRNIVVSGSKKFDGVIKGGLSKITITIPHILNEVDNDNKYYRFISSVSDIIYNSRIKVQDGFFTPREIVLVLDDEDALRAYELLKPTITTNTRLNNGVLQLIRSASPYLSLSHHGISTTRQRQL